MRYHALIPAAGNGSRFRGDAPKQYWMLDGKPVLVHSLERLAAAFPLAARSMWRSLPAIAGTTSRSARGPASRSLRCGGATRGETVRNALAALTDAGDDDWILIHDAVRPCVDPASLSRLRAGASARRRRRFARAARRRNVEACGRRRPQRGDRAARGTVVGADAADVPVRRPARARSPIPSPSITPTKPRPWKR